MNYDIDRAVQAAESLMFRDAFEYEGPAEPEDTTKFCPVCRDERIDGAELVCRGCIESDDLQINAEAARRLERSQALAMGAEIRKLVAAAHIERKEGIA